MHLTCSRRSVKGSSKRKGKAKATSNGIKETSMEEVTKADLIVSANGGEIIQRKKGSTSASPREGSSSSSAQRHPSVSDANTKPGDTSSPEANDVEDINVTIHDEQNNLNLNRDEGDQDFKADSYSKKFDRNVVGASYYRAWHPMEKAVNDTDT